jgi:glycosyltransferase involved in cell wall biosynthesis
VTPIVSIVTPAYNASRYIAETIRSVCDQSYEDWEWIIVDDGSTDDTREVIARETAALDRVCVYEQENKGVSAARNRGLEAARGRYLALLDADDLWLPENLERKVSVLRQEPDVAFVYSNMYRHFERSGQTLPAEPGKGEQILRNLLLWNGEVIPTICSNLVYRRYLHDGGLRFDTRFSTAADLEFAFRLAAKAQGRLIGERLFTYRVLPGSMSRDLGRAERELIALYRNAGTLGLFETAAFRRRCFANLYLILAGNWWIDGNDRLRGLTFVLRAIAAHPWALLKLTRKSLRRIFAKSLIC